MATYFISGPLNITQDRFEELYVPILKEKISLLGNKFIIGDARGVDTLMVSCQCGTGTSYRIPYVH